MVLCTQVKLSTPSHPKPLVSNLAWQAAAQAAADMDNAHLYLSLHCKEHCCTSKCTAHSATQQQDSNKQVTGAVGQ